MIESDPPPNGSERAAPRQPDAQSRAPDKPDPKKRTGTPAAGIAANAGKPVSAAEPPRTRAAGAGAATPARAAPGARQAHGAGASADQPAKPAAGRPANGAGGSPLTASNIRQRASAELATRRAAAASDPYPALSEGSLNATGAAATNSRTPGRAAPRSPRTALEPDTVEMPTRRSKTARHPFVIIGNAIISLFVLAALLAGVALVRGKQRFEAPGPLPQDHIVNIPRGSGIRDIADALVREGVIDQPWVFVGGVLVLKAREDLKAGEYQFKAHASLRDVVSTIVEGRVVMHQFTIPEGLTSEQMVARLLNDDVLTGNIKEFPREGSLLPDTYNFARGLTREQMIQRMQQAEQRAVKEIWDRRSPDLPLRTPDQLVILASLIEKETGKAEERTRVAAVFVNRLKQKMRLQSDPTIIYGLVGGKGTLGRPIAKSDVDQPTPYNTYLIDGLPPGPIANPGRASLEAAASPARTRELYFVADGTGGHAFAETYEQHQRNVARLRANEGDHKDQAPADTQLISSPSPASPAPQRRISNHHN